MIMMDTVVVMLVMVLMVPVMMGTVVTVIVMVRMVIVMVPCDDLVMLVMD